MKLINPLLIIRILSTVVLIESLAFLLCLPVAWYYHEAGVSFIISAFITMIISALAHQATLKTDLSKFTNRDGYLCGTLSLLLLTLIGTFPYLMSGTITSFIDAFFESASGFTTTGSTVLKNIEKLPHVLLFYRSLTQWIGGIGIIALLILVLPSLKFSGYQLFSVESNLQEKFHPKTNAIGFRILILYIGLTLAEIILLSLGGMTVFDSICHSFATISTGGFSTRNSNIISYSSYIQYIIMFFMLLAGLSQVIFYYIIKMNYIKVRQNEELWFYFFVVIIAGSIATITLLSNSTLSLAESFRTGFFQVISVISCTGFYSTNYNLWPGTGIMLIFLLMFAGASTGSSGGGIRMARHLIVLKNIRNAFIKLNHPKSISVLRFNGRIIPENINISIISFVVLYILIFVIGTMFVVLTGVDPITAASSSATCLAGIGPGLGDVGPLSSFANLPGTAKMGLSLLMIIGRLEILTVFAIFTRTFWKL